jgi:hypothetical protein
MPGCIALDHMKRPNQTACNGISRPDQSKPVRRQGETFMTIRDRKTRAGRLAAIVTTALCAAMAPARAAGPDSEPVPIAVLNLDYDDRSGELRDQQQAHATRLEHFAATLRRDLAASGRYRIVYPACDPAPCAAAGADPATLVAAARKAGARLMMFGGVHKMSTLVEWAKLLVIDVPTEKIVFDRLITFRGDDDEAWNRAAAFSVQEFLAPPAAR